MNIANFSETGVKDDRECAKKFGSTMAAGGCGSSHDCGDCHAEAIDCKCGRIRQGVLALRCRLLLSSRNGYLHRRRHERRPTGTAGGTWDWRSPNNPHTWAPTPADACQNGQLVKFGDVSSSGLTQDAYSRWKTNTHYALKLGPGQYIASILYRGGFTGVDNQGNFCMCYYDPINGIVFPPLGCIDTSPQAGVPATLVFAPDTPVPPSSISQPYLVGANGADWKAVSAADIQGSLSIWLCLQRRQG